MEFSEEEIRRLRAATRGTAEKVHFNNAGASLPPDVVVDTVTRYLTDEAACGGYETEAAYAPAIDHVYASIARLINADAGEIALVESASVAWGIAFNGISFREGDVVLTSEMEYVTNVLGFLALEKTKGIKIEVIPNDENNNFSLAALEAAISPRTRLIAITHIPSTAGNVMPVADIWRIARKHGILYLVDACQSVGQAQVDVKALHCDFLAVTGRKYLRAPRGTGFLYVRKEVQGQLNPIFIDGRSISWVSTTDFRLRDDAKRFELYERSWALALGLGAAVDYALEIGVDRIWARILYLSDLLRTGLSALGGIVVHDKGTVRCGIVTFSVAGADAALVKRTLAERRINVSIGLAKSTPIYMDRHHLDNVIRASIHYYNTEEEINLLCRALTSVII